MCHSLLFSQPSSVKQIRISVSIPRYNRDEIFVRDDVQEVRLLNTFGFYWHFFMKISEALRSIDNNEGPTTDADGEVS